jgi:hypothetical protein
MNEKITRLVVAKSRTIRPGEGEEWVRTEYTLEAAIDHDEEVAIAKAQLEGLIDGWLTGVAKPAKPAPQLPQLDPDELAKLPWKTYKTKEGCKPDEPGWIFRNTPGAAALADLIKTQGKGTPVQIGPNKFECSFSGAEKQFIGRKPVK